MRLFLLALLIFTTGFKYGDCVQTKSGRKGEFIETRETRVLSVHAFVRWNDMPKEIIDGTHYPDELVVCQS